MARFCCWGLMPESLHEWLRYHEANVVLFLARVGEVAKTHRGLQKQLTAAMDIDYYEFSRIRADPHTRWAKITPEKYTAGVMFLRNNFGNVLYTERKPADISSDPIYAGLFAFTNSEPVDYDTACSKLPGIYAIYRHSHLTGDAVLRGILRIRRDDASKALLTTEDYALPQDYATVSTAWNLARSGFLVFHQGLPLIASRRAGWSQDIQFIYITNVQDAYVDNKNPDRVSWMTGTIVDTFGPRILASRVVIVDEGDALKEPDFVTTLPPAKIPEAVREELDKPFANKKFNMLEL